MMRFLIDNALSPLVAQGLCQANYDAVHVREIGLGSASDSVIFERAPKEDRIIVSADTDFGSLLASRQKSKPSFILFRGGFIHLPQQQLSLLLANLPGIRKYLERGSIIVIEKDRMRVRSLPIK